VWSLPGLLQNPTFCIEGYFEGVQERITSPSVSHQGGTKGRDLFFVAMQAL
jgi:hypothetical protein